MINYKSFADMNETIVKNLHKFPHDIDLVIGIPRSGMMPANLIALYLNKPYTSIEQFCNGVIYANGSRLIDISDINKVLVIDDSSNTGKELNKAKDLLKDFNITKIFGAIYVTFKQSSVVDVYCEIVEQPRLFQWNVFNTSKVKYSMFDLDGVLCTDPEIDDDGEQYIKQITTAKPLYIPKYTIDNIVTCRLEKYRDLTEKWLKENNVSYNHLTMLDFSTKTKE